MFATLAVAAFIGVFKKNVFHVALKMFQELPNQSCNLIYVYLGKSHFEYKIAC